MRIEHEGISLWYGTPDAPAPQENVSAGQQISVTVGVSPADASNRIEIRYQVNQGETQIVTARYIPNSGDCRVQYFRASLSALNAGDVVEYTPVCRCAGRQIPVQESMEEFTSSCTVVEATVKNPITRSISRPDKTFIVRGRIVTRDGSPPEIPMTVTAFNQGVVRKQQLGKIRTEADGSYEIEYSRSQLEPGQEQANLFVEVIVSQRQRIRSPLILNADPEEIINLAITEPDEDFRGLSQYVELLAQLKPFLPRDDLNKISDRGIILIAQKAQVPEQQVGYLVQALRLAEQTEVDAAIWYALFTQGSPTDLMALVGEGEPIHRTRLNAAIEDNIISERFQTQIDRIVDQLKDIAIEETLLDRTEPSTEPSIREVLNRTRLAPAQKRTLLKAWVNRNASPEEFWTEIRQRNDFEDEAVDEVQRVTQLSILSLGHMPMADTLLSNNIQDAKQIATLEVDNLVDLMGNVDPPEGVEGKTPADRKRAYADKMLGLAIESFPTARLLHKWTNDTEVSTQDFVSFNQDNPNFEFKTTTVRKYLRANPQALENVSDPNTFVSQLEGMSRLFSLVPEDDKFDAVRTLWQSDIPNSAFGITRLNESAFMRKFKGKLTPTQSQIIHASARHKATVTMATLMRYSPLFNPIQPAAMNWAIAPQELPDDIPDWSTLFGSLDFCECKHCRSIQSPAAYFVDLLQFLEESNAGSRSGLEQLLRQRPDLAHIRLDCANTNTAMPYIDLVNEVLENAVANGPPFNLSVENPPQTTATTEELRAYPEHILPAAYETLAGDFSTWSLPFDLAHEERQVYLNHLGITVAELMDTFHRPGDLPKPIDRAMAHLGMTLVERQIITGETGNHGLGSSDAVLTIMKRSQLSYEQLHKLLTSEFINPNGKEIEFEVGSCALEDATLDLTNGERNRLHRFTRLHRILGWSVTELDHAIAVVGNGSLNNAFLIQLAALKQLKERFKRSIPELLSWWGPISTRPYGDKKSLYEQLFLNTTVNNPLNPPDAIDLNDIFGLNDARTEVNNPNAHHLLEEGDLDPEITPLVLAAINISADDLRLLIQSVLPNDQVNLDNLSQLYRIASLARTLRISIREYLTLTQLTNQFGLTHFELPNDTPQDATPEDTWNFIKLFDRLTASGFSIQELDYLLAHRFSPDFPIPLTNDAIAIALAELRTELKKLNPTQPLQDLLIDDLKALLTEKLALVFEEVEISIAIIDGSSELSETEQEAYITEQFSNQKQFATFLDPDAVNQNLIQVGLTDEKERILFVLTPLIKFLTANLVVQHLTSITGLAVDVCESLLRVYLAHPQDETQRAISVFLNDDFIYSKVDTADTDAFPSAYAVITRLAKLSIVLARLGIPATELEFVLSTGRDIGWYDLSNIPVETIPEQTALDSWLRLTESYQRDRQLFSGTFSLVQLLKTVHDNSLNQSELLSLVSEQTGWDLVSLEFLVGQQGYNFNFPADFQDEQWLTRLQQAFALIKKAGVTASQIWQWNSPSATIKQARQIRNAAKARYDTEQWLAIAPQLTNQLRIKRRNALRDFLLANHSEFRDTDDLYGHFLIDSEMSPCFMTSRIKQAISSVQLFVHRMFMGLEPEVRFERDEAEQWLWRKNYRVWEANRKVFLYPENYTEPELRDDKTPFFEELREALLQEEVTADAVERAYLTYLRRLDEVARLEISGLYKDPPEYNQDPDVTDEVVHIFARTKGVPPIYYYRRWVDQAYFTPWEKVDINIEGEHLLPVVYNRRLWLLWPIFTEKAKEPSQSELDKNEKPKKYWEIKLSWSEYRQGKWSTPKTSENSISTKVPNNSVYKFEHKGRFYFWAEVKKDSLCVYLFYHQPSHPYHQFYGIQPSGFFCFLGCGEDPKVGYRSNPEQQTSERDFWFPNEFAYRVPNAVSFNRHMKFQQAKTMTMFSDITVGNDGIILIKNSKIEKIFTKAPDFFYITPPHQYLHFYSQAPFFYEDSKRTFFVIPESIYGSNSSPSTTVGSLQNSLNRGQIDLGSLSGIRSAILPLPQQTDDSSLQRESLTLSQSRSRTFTIADQNTVINRVAITASEDEPETLTDEIVATAVVPVTRTPFGSSIGDILSNENVKKVYHFRTFYHPYTCLFIEQLNRFGIEGLLKPVTVGDGKDLHRQLTPSSTFNFGREYGFQARTLIGFRFRAPKEDIDFTHEGAYSQYNWELFFHIPMLIANQLSQNRRFEDAQRWYHYIFDPTETENEGLDADEQHRRFWKLKPFYQFNGATTLQEIVDLINRGNSEYENQISQWEENPFNPHLIARLRIVAYMKSVVMKYLDNLIAWADSLFKQDTIESINEATQLYVLAAQILGRQPEQVKGREVTARSFADLRSSLDELSNARVTNPLLELETQIPTRLLPKNLQLKALPTKRFNERVALKDQAITAPKPANAIAALARTFMLTDIGVLEQPRPQSQPPMLYFCLLPNNKLLTYWDTIGDRLFKIRNCMNIEGVTRSLALFQPPIDPALLIRAVAAGVDLSSALSDLNAPLPNYRFTYILQKALELCNDIKSLGGALLSALEKRDAEELSLLRAGHEIDVLKSIRQMKQKTIEEAKESITSLEKSRELADIRYQYYSSREYKNPSEITHTSELELARGLQEGAEFLNVAASIAFLIPDIKLGVQGVSTPELTASFGGTFLGNLYRAESSALSYLAARHSHAATMASIEGGHQRRADDWEHQAGLAQKEIEQIEQQITTAKVRVEIAERDLASQELQIQNSQEVFQFMKDKYTNQQLYSWMISQISTLYFQSYQMAYDLAKRAEQCFRYELGIENTNFIEFGYWDSLKKGLLSGERLHKDLKRMEIAYLEQNRREYEITKHVSLALLEPLALVKLRETGQCVVDLPEEIFDLDYPGHYFRRIKSVSITLPCVVGPYTTISCTLRLLKNSIRINTSIPDGYPRNTDDAGFPTTDNRFIENNIPVKAIAASNAQNDSGIFELNFRDERYLPFEGAGAISQWSLELFHDNSENFGKDLRQFDYSTITDAILHIKYMAREDAGPFKSGAIAHLREYFSQDEATPSLRMFNLRQEFPSQWHRFLYPTDPEDGNVFELEMSPNLFPIRDHGKTLKVNTIWLLARCTNADNYEVVMTPPLPEPPPADSNTMTLARVNQYGGLHFRLKDVAAMGIEIVPTANPPVKWQLKMSRPGGGNLQEDPVTKVMEVEDVLLVLGYEWE